MKQVPGVEAFRAWLCKHAPQERIGRVADPVECPLARFFSLYYGVPCEVSRFSYRLVPELDRAGLPVSLWLPEEKHELPSWAWEFGETLDHTYAFDEHHRFIPSLPMVQAQVLQVLDAMMACR